MNWLYKSFQSKPLPLPVDPPIGYRDVGTDLIDDKMRQETADSLKEEQPDISWLGAGAGGVAVNCGPGVVCKYTWDSWEAEAGRMIMDNNIKGAVKVYEVR